MNRRNDSVSRRTLRGTAAFVLSILALSANVAAAATFVVNSNDDDVDATPGDGSCSTGNLIILSSSPFLLAQECTLRAAIEEANGLAGTDTLEFSQYLPTVAGVVEFSPTSGLPLIFDPIVIDGYSHPSYNDADPGARPIINILGGGTPAGTYGLAFLPGADNSGVYGLAIVDFPSSGILISPFFSGAPNGITVQGSHIGVWRGVFYRGNGLDGIEVVSSNNNTIGQSCGFIIGCRGKRNVIASNDRHGVMLRGTSTGNRVAGNYIGVDHFGSSTFVPFGGSTSNAEWGVYVDEDATANDIGSLGSTFDLFTGATTTVAAGNVISGNHSGGVYLGSTFNEVYANHIGTNAAGTGALANDGPGVSVYGDDNIVGNVGVSSNLISGNNGSGIVFETPSGFTPRRTHVYGNRIGVNAATTATLGNSGSGIVVWGVDHEIFSNVIGGNHIGINDSGYSGTIARNFIGTNSSGANLGNLNWGILVSEGDELIGGVGNGNTIGFNSVGIRTAGSSYNVTIAGNYIGTNSAHADLGNLASGIIANGAENVIGGMDGLANGLRNVIAFNRGDGISVFGYESTIQGNFVGTNANGDDMGNAGAAIYANAWPGSNNTVGASASEIPANVAAAGNVFAHNGEGIFVINGDEFAIRGNELFANYGIGIDLEGDGETDNDNLDLDTGANRLQNKPVFDTSLTYWNGVTGDLEIRYMLPAAGPADVTYPLTIDFYIHDPWLQPGDQARAWVGTDSYTAVEAGTYRSITLTPPAGTMVPNGLGFVFEGLRATAMDADANTSELSTQGVPVPEPGFASMLVAGVLGGAALSRRSRRAVCSTAV